MEIEPTVLLAYAIIWTIFYALLSKHIAKLSRDKWIEYVKSEESDDVLVEGSKAFAEGVKESLDKFNPFKDLSKFNPFRKK